MSASTARPATEPTSERSRPVPDQVDAIDVAARMIERAHDLTSVGTPIRWITGDLLDPSVPLAAEGYDAVTAVSSLHHMPLAPALDRLVGLVRPGGVLAWWVSPSRRRQPTSPRLRSASRRTP